MYLHINVCVVRAAFSLSQQLQYNKRITWLCQAKENLLMDINFAFEVQHPSLHVVRILWSSKGWISVPLVIITSGVAPSLTSRHLHTVAVAVYCGSITSCDPIQGLHVFEVIISHLSTSQSLKRKTLYTIQDQKFSLPLLVCEGHSVASVPTPKAIVKWYIQTVAVSLTAGSTLTHHKDNTHSGSKAQAMLDVCVKGWDILEASQINSYNWAYRVISSLC